ncbi:unnamed protein product [Vitrella brassicaformis CCMP3155]|uniref:Uncharacterized protein n=1 Tax=Vitrella brassicaformis (strain CCMP3155) TaxID=1169540 RepID=A0A0G4FQ70_VITBC|nr:unnamed protein product [Vitrella brassicaformis CCMP3155]|eukprot:CEM16430.1 unnamed protein product [Vitrella brassicaformis CCMP3155]
MTSKPHVRVLFIASHCAIILLATALLVLTVELTIRDVMTKRTAGDDSDAEKAVSSPPPAPAEIQPCQISMPHPSSQTPSASGLVLSFIVAFFAGGLLNCNSAWAIPMF